MNILILLAGKSTEFFSKGFSYPKYLIEINGKPLVEYVINQFNLKNNANFHFIILKEDKDKFHLDSIIKLLLPNANIITTENVTKGAACSVLLAIEYINNDTPLLIVNGDQILNICYQNAINTFVNKKLDGGIITFDSIHPRWSYIRLNDMDYVTEVAEKNPISRNATAGAYYFKYGKFFVDSAMSMIEKNANVNELYYVSPTYNEMILRHLKIGVYKINRNHYISAANPEDIPVIKKFFRHKDNEKI